jgi:hypothetical protein
VPVSPSSVIEPPRVLGSVSIVAAIEFLRCRASCSRGSLGQMACGASWLGGWGSQPILGSCFSHSAEPAREACLSLPWFVCRAGQCLHGLNNTLLASLDHNSVHQKKCSSEPFTEPVQSRLRGTAQFLA